MKITIPSRGAAPPPAVAAAAAAGTGTGSELEDGESQSPEIGQGQGQQGAGSGSGQLGKRKRSSAEDGQSATATASTSRAQGDTRPPAVQLYETMRDYRKDGRTISTEFMSLPPRDAFPDYYSTIKKPISFSEISQKIEAGAYSANLKLMADDFHQVFVNAKRYNQKGSSIFNDAKRLDKLVKTTYQKITGLSFEGFGDSAPSYTGIGRADSSALEGSVPPLGSPALLAVAAGGGPIAPPGPRKRGRPSKNDQHHHQLYQAQQRQQAAQQQQQQQKQGKSTTAAAAAAQDEKPVTLTKWLTNKVDDLVATTDAYGRALAPIFVHLPPQAQYPDYYQLIQRPVSFQLVRSRLKNRNYPTIQKFVDDVNAIFDNAMYYNKEHSQVWEDARLLKDRFAEIMREPAPEFHVRPRNKDQQAVTPLYAQQQQQQQQHLYPHQQTLHTAVGGDAGQITLHMGQHGAIENIAFADEWDDEAPLEQQQQDDGGTQIDQQVKREDNNQDDKSSKSPLPPSILGAGPTPVLAQDDQPATAAAASQERPKARRPSSSTLPGAAVQQQPRVRVLATLPSESSPAIISSFLIELVYSSPSSPLDAPSSSFLPVLKNTSIRQHAITVPAAVERINILPCFAADFGGIGDTANLKVQMRPAHSVAEVESDDNDAKRVQAQASGNDGEEIHARIKWITRPVTGLNTYEIINTEEKNGLYRIFVNKNPA